MGLFAGLDIGTQSVKLVVYDPAPRQIVATAGQPLDLAAGDDGSREQRADWWVDAIGACFARIDPALRARVAAIGVSGQQRGFVPPDRGGHVPAPAKLGNDNSTTAQCDEIMDAARRAPRRLELAG